MSDARVRLDNARKLFELKRYPQAAELYSAAIAADASQAAVFAERARCHYRMGCFAQAIADLARAVELSPQTASYYFTRGRYCVEAGQFEEACRDFTTVLDLEQPEQERPFSEAAAFFRAEANLHLRRFKEAIHDCSKVRDHTSLYVLGRVRTKDEIARDATAGLQGTMP